MIPSSAAKQGWLALGVLALTACTAAPRNLQVHEVALYGAGAQRVVWVYGDLAGQSSSTLKLGADTVTLRPQVAGGLSGSLSVNEKATFTAPLRSSVPTVTLTRQGDRFAVAGSSVKALYFTDGQRWQQLSSVSGSAAGRSVTGLRGAGNLTDAEADALTAALSGQGMLAVAVLDESAAPDAPLKVEPQPTEQRRTVLYVLNASQITTVTTNATTTSTTTNSTVTTSPAPVTGGQTVNAAEVASGSNAAAEGASVVVARTPAEVQNLYRIAYGRQTGGPSVPTLTAGEALVGVFIGPRNTGGYGVRLQNAALSGNVLKMQVELTTPRADAIVTQALTNPWTIVRVKGTFGSVSVTDQTGRAFPY